MVISIFTFPKMLGCIARHNNTTVHVILLLIIRKIPVVEFFIPRKRIFDQKLFNHMAVEN